MDAGSEARRAVVAWWVCWLTLALPFLAWALWLALPADPPPAQPLNPTTNVVIVARVLGAPLLLYSPLLLFEQRAWPAVSRAGMWALWGAASLALVVVGIVVAFAACGRDAKREALVIALGAMGGVALSARVAWRLGRRSPWELLGGTLTCGVCIVLLAWFASVNGYLVHCET
jgi:hypothetical protein